MATKKCYAILPETPTTTMKLLATVQEKKEQTRSLHLCIACHVRVHGAVPLSESGMNISKLRKELEYALIVTL